MTCSVIPAGMQLNTFWPEFIRNPNFLCQYTQTHVGILIQMVNAGLKVSASCDLQDSDCSNGESLDSAGVLY